MADPDGGVDSVLDDMAGESPAVRSDLSSGGSSIFASMASLVGRSSELVALTAAVDALRARRARPGRGDQRRTGHRQVAAARRAGDGSDGVSGARRRGVGVRARPAVRGLDRGDRSVAGGARTTAAGLASACLPRCLLSWRTGTRCTARCARCSRDSPARARLCCARRPALGRRRKRRRRRRARAASARGPRAGSRSRPARASCRAGRDRSRRRRPRRPADRARARAVVAGRGGRARRPRRVGDLRAEWRQPVLPGGARASERDAACR